jgi:hypothetical protein
MSQPLCKYSRSEILASLVLRECPLGLREADLDECPCRRREHIRHGNTDLRVLTCLFPKTWQGQTIASPPAFAFALRRRIDQKKAAAREAAADLPPTEKEKPTVTTSQPPPPASREPAAPAERRPLWVKPIPIIGVTGEFASGKTLFGLTIAPGPDTLVYDMEKSSEPYVDIGFDRIDVPAELVARYPRGGYKPVDVWLWWRDHVRNLTPGKYRVIMLDDVGPVEAGLADYVQAHPQEFGRTAHQYQKSSGLMWGDVKQAWKGILSDIASRCETFVFVTHTGAVWADNKPTMKRKPKGKETLEELASLYLWLERRPDGKGCVPAVPSAIVRKTRLAHTRINPETGEVEITPALPPRLPQATPAAIRQYQRTPPDYAKLKPAERAPEETLSEDDRAELRARTAEAEAEAERLRLERQQRQEAAQERLAAARAAGAPAAREGKESPARPRPATQPSSNGTAHPAPAPARPADTRPAAALAEAAAESEKEHPAPRLAPTEAQLNHLLEMRKALIEFEHPENIGMWWIKQLKPWNATSARDLDRKQADELIVALEKALKKHTHGTPPGEEAPASAGERGG